MKYMFSPSGRQGLVWLDSLNGSHNCFQKWAEEKLALVLSGFLEMYLRVIKKSAK